MKTKILLFFLFIGGFISAQQNQEFKEIKDYFDQQQHFLQTEFVKKYKNSSEESKVSLKKQYIELMQTLDSIRNVAYVEVLIRVKNLEEISNLNLYTNKSLNSQLQENKIDEMPVFPNGLDALRDKVASLFYTKGIDKKNKVINTVVSFVVEKDGSISDIRASGEDICLNKQAEIAMYLIPEKFSKPATINGNAVRYSYRMPLTIKFE